MRDKIALPFVRARDHRVLVHARQYLHVRALENAARRRRGLMAKILRENPHKVAGPLSLTHTPLATPTPSRSRVRTVETAASTYCPAARYVSLAPQPAKGAAKTRRRRCRRASSLSTAASQVYRFADRRGTLTDKSEKKIFI